MAKFLKVTPTIQRFQCNPQELSVLAGDFSRCLMPGDWIFLIGDLGTGKTTFVQEVAKTFDIKDKVTSPTFSLIQEIEVSSSWTSVKKILHLDLYRLKYPKDLYYLGLESLFDKTKSIVFIEWPDIFSKEDWNNFFALTQCTEPSRMIQIKISYAEKFRDYEIVTVSKEGF